MRSISLLVAPLVGLAGCTTEPSVPSPLVAEVPDLDVPVSVEVGSAVGTGEVAVPVRLVNSYGAAIPGSSVTVSLQSLASQPRASLVETELAVDATGYATARVTAPSPEAFVITATASADGASTGSSAISYAVGSQPYRFALQQGVPISSDVTGAPDRVAIGTRGVAVSFDSQVWWVPAAPGQPPEQVADLPFSVSGMWGGPIDGDDIDDLVLWGTTQVVLMRGRADGGYGFEGAWSVDSGTVMDVAVADLDGDNLADLAISTDTDSGATVDFLRGDGVWGFEPQVPLVVDFGVMSLTGTDEGDDGRPDLTLISESTGTLRRYTLDADGWVQGSPAEISYNATQGARLLDQTHLDPDRSYDLVLVGAPGSSSQDLVFWTMTDQTVWNNSYGNFEAAIADMDGSSTTDLLALENNVLHVIYYDESRVNFVGLNVNDVGDMGPTAAGDLDGDGVGDVAVGTADAVRFMSGKLNDSGFWRLASPTWTSFHTAFTGPWTAQDVNDDGLVDLVGFTTSDGDLVLKVWTTHLNSSGALQLTAEGQLDLGAGATAYALDYCEGDGFYALVSSGTNETLMRVKVTDSDGRWTPVEQASTTVSGTLLACGTTGSGYSGAVVADTSGNWATYSWAMVSLSTGSLGPIYDVALADLDGTRVGQVLGCTESGCSMAVADVDGDGADEVFTGGSTVTVQGWGDTTTLAGSGTVSVGDADGDGHPDILALDADKHLLLVYRGVAGGVTPPVGYVFVRTLLGPAWTGDLTGDGMPEVLVGDDSGTTWTTGATLEPGQGLADNGGDTEQDTGR